MLSEKHVVITGAASGIGAATARQCAARGASLTLLDKNADGLNQTEAACREFGDTIHTVECDVTDNAACASAIAAALDRFGDIGVLINNAGIAQRSAVIDTKSAVVERVMMVNFMGAVHCTLHALPSLVRTRGRVGVISSVAGFSPLLGRASYCASKHALHGFFDTLRAEIAPHGVSVTIVCPSFTDSNLDRSAVDGQGRPAMSPRSMIGRLAAPDDVAKTILAAVEGRKRMTVMTARGKSAYWLSRVAPGVYDRLMTRLFRGEIEHDA